MVNKVLTTPQLRKIELSTTCVKVPSTPDADYLPELLHNVTIGNDNELRLLNQFLRKPGGANLPSSKQQQQHNSLTLQPIKPERHHHRQLQVQLVEQPLQEGPALWELSAIYQVFSPTSVPQLYQRPSNLHGLKHKLHTGCAGNTYPRMDRYNHDLGGEEDTDDTDDTPEQTKYRKQHYSWSRTTSASSTTSVASSTSQNNPTAATTTVQQTTTGGTLTTRILRAKLLTANEDYGLNSPFVSPP
ncbi:uncharacterized protein [Musca autumnalis]|uniref:uncharacterized protein n=1 Tax=Musca autumnalis TaxID=221902 RepID=UPI003CF82565